MDELKSLHEILQKIANTSGRNDKESLLKQNKDNQLLKDVLQFVFDSFIVTGISSKKIKKKVKNQPKTVQGISSLNELMQYLRKNNTGKDYDIEVVQNFIYKIEDTSIQQMVADIVTKSLTIGATSGTCNKVFGEGFIQEFDVMLAEKYEDYEAKIKNDEVFIITTKIDGNRMMLIKDDGVVRCFSRQGKLMEGLDEIVAEASTLPNGYCFDGELVAINNDNLASDVIFRETMTKARKKGKKDGLEFLVFDMLPLEDFKKGICKTPCLQRKINLIDIVSKRDFDFIKAVPIMYVGTDKQKIFELLEEVTNKGEEGLMVNIANAPYECKRTKNILKVKKFKDADVLVISMENGTGANEDKLGAIEIRFIHNDKYYECNCGSGFSQDERVKYWNNPELLIDKIVTIRYFGVSKNDGGTYGLRFPTWASRIRDDKSEISMY